MNSTTFITAALATALALVSAASPASAQAAGRTMRQLTVDARGFDTSTPAGRAMLHSRIIRAAQTVCGTNTDMRDLADYAEYRSCFSKAVASGDMQLAALSAKEHGAAVQRQVASNQGH